MTNEKKYQIFVSSTYEDLKDERKAVIEEILELRQLPVGMELFQASNDEQFEYIKKIIDNSDYYVLILGGRYGSVSPLTKKSYTEMEFRYAVSKEIPILIFPYKNLEKLSQEKKDKDLDKIKTFTAMAIEKRICKHWENKSELQLAVLKSLHEQFDTNPQIGWQRYEDKTTLLEELNAVRKEKDALIAKNTELIQKQEMNTPSIENIAGLDENYKIIFEHSTGTGRSYYRQTNEFFGSWNDIFSYIAPSLIKPNNTDLFKNLINKFIDFKTGKYPSELNDDYVNTIKIQLAAHKLIRFYSAKSTNGGVVEFIELTDKGLAYLQSIKVVKTAINK